MEMNGFSSILTHQFRANEIFKQDGLSTFCLNMQPWIMNGGTKTTLLNRFIIITECLSLKYSETEQLEGFHNDQLTGPPSNFNFK